MSGLEFRLFLRGQTPGATWKGGPFYWFLETPFRVEGLGETGLRQSFWGLRSML